MSALTVSKAKKAAAMIKPTKMRKNSFLMNIT